MAPPGRRRTGLSPMTTLLALVFLFTSTASAASAVLGIDLGTEYIKAALVKPGIPLEIVLTKDSKRKEVSAVAFKPAKAGQLAAGAFPERFYGSDAVALQARFPGEVYPNLKQLLGVGESDEVVQIFRERYPAVGVGKGRLGVNLQSGIFAEGEKEFSVEELLAMELENVKANAQTLAGKGSSIEDVVFTVPPFYTVDERRALEVAAKLAGFKVQAMITDGLAVGINYATSRTFPLVKDGGKPEVHLVFDMGAGSASATVLQFQGKQVKDVGRFNKTVQEVQVLGTGWDKTLGGDALNTIIFNDMVNEFVQLPGAKKAGVTAENVKAHGRTAAKLWKEAEKVRQVLSANQQISSFFEELFEEVDFRYKLTRTKFEEMTTEYASRVDGPIRRALDAAKLDIKDIDSFIIHGGASRTPFVQSRLEELVGKDKIKANVNSDEAAVFGAAFKAATLSPSFRVKEIRDIDTQGYNHGIQYMFNLKNIDQKIFTPTTKIGATKDMHFQMMGDFEFKMYQAVPSADGEVAKKPVLDFSSGNMTRVVTKLIDESKCDRDSFNNYVQVRLSPVTGTPEILAAWVTCESEAEEPKAGIVDGIKGFFGGGKKDQEALKEGESASESASASASDSVADAASSVSSAAAEATDAVKSPKKKEVRSAITFTVKQLGYVKVPRKEMKRMQDRLSAFSASDKSRRTREEHLNTLEAFTYRARDYLEDESFIASSTAAIRDTLESKLSAASDWIYAEGHEATEEVLKAKLKELKDIVNPVLKRMEEAASRPAAMKELQDAIDGLKSIVPMIKANIEEGAAAASKSAASEAAASPASSDSASADPLAELDDDAAASASASASSTTEAPAFNTELPAIYTDEEVKSLEDSLAAASAWLAEKEAAQAKLSASDDAAVSIKEIKEHAKKLNDAITQMMTRKMNAMNAHLRNQQQGQKPKAKPKAKSKSKASKKGKKNGKRAADKDAEKATEEAKTGSGPSEEELAEAMEKAGLKGQGLKLENLGQLRDLKDKDGKPMIKLGLKEDASEEEILAAIDEALAEARKGKESDKGHDEL